MRGWAAFIARSQLYMEVLVCVLRKRVEISTPLTQQQIPPYVPHGVKITAFNFMTGLKVFPTAERDESLFPQRQTGDLDQVISSSSLPF